MDIGDLKINIDNKFSDDFITIAIYINVENVIEESLNLSEAKQLRDHLNKVISNYEQL
jgi:hypothetical protein